MKPFSTGTLIVAGIAVAAAVAFAGTAYAQSSKGNDTKSTPFSYVIKDGKPVPKGKRITNPDGSWREETRVGNCVTIKEGSPNGEVRTTRRCD